MIRWYEAGMSPPPVTGPWRDWIVEQAALGRTQTEIRALAKGLTGHGRALNTAQFGAQRPVGRAEGMGWHSTACPSCAGARVEWRGRKPA